MHRFKRLITAIFLTVLSILLLFSAAFAYLIVTPLGGKILVRYFKQEFSSIGVIHIGSYAGTLQNGFVLKDMRMTGLPYLPNALVRIQEIQVHLPLADLRHSDLDIFNARIFIPGGDPVVFTGRLYEGQIAGELYANSVDIHEASRFWTDEDIQKNLRGYLTNIDFTVHGPISSPGIEGSFAADGIQYKSIQLTNGQARADMTLLPDTHQFQMKGRIDLNSGMVKVKDVNLQILPGYFIFQGDFLNPTMDVLLGGHVEDMDIHLTIKGNVANPQLTVSSDPPMAPQEALQVLFTGNAFSAATSPFNGITSGELAQDFLDYSITDINDENVGLKTKLTQNLKLGVEMDQLPTPPGETTVYYSRKIDGEMDLNDHMSLNVSREVLPQDRDPSTSSQDAQPLETQVYVQYKKRF
jgi:hypothetical protein